MKGFSFGGKWWHYLVHVTVKGGPLFFLGLFSFVFTSRGVLFYGISVYSVLFFVCAGVLFSFVLLPLKARRRFYFLPFCWRGWWDSLGSSEKKKSFI